MRTTPQPSPAPANEPVARRRRRRLRLDGAVCVVTGAASGMGLESARLLARRGARLALVDRNADVLAELVEELRAAGTEASAHVVDLTDLDAVAALPDAVLAHHDHVDVLLHCAGVSMLGTFEQLTLDEFRWVVDVNLWGTVALAKAFLPLLRERPAAHLANVSSLYGLAAPAGRVPYVTSKFAVRGFTDALRHELERTDVTVSAVYPGGVRTGIIHHARVAATVDADVASRAADAQAALYKTTPEQAAETIVAGIERRRPRIFVGRDARLSDLVTRVAPVGYWSVMRGIVAKAGDTASTASAAAN
ncbi:SDR family NAD(P)-dependent oxidoreductase [Agromyces mangrovi Wang et al. 2018]|uniref:SDR family NAD(P)-dependent oxidoreductase n=1 Tax=Agromyces mangrovi TaxID=1858653 RepID=UPI0025742C1D|nr:SDR family NAD(P)-dependent oxidoreductase [Agromyces mangrovi]BDZ64791.1 acetoin dehydrogenase [Agromyces mangrovi]